MSADYLCGRVHGGGGPQLAHEALLLLRMRRAARRTALHHARGTPVLLRVLRDDVRRVLRDMRGEHRRRPGTDEPRRAALARAARMFPLQIVPHVTARPAVSAARWRHLLLDRL